ncbi:MAG TPA: hypothetical protein VJ385_14895 [Fibrobacteria bacterium]|nr:hypothetical protein [Fibrobacteria bacterium]
MRTRRRPSPRAWVLLPILGALPALGGNQALVTGGYGGTLGAGGATGGERSAFGQNPAALRPGGTGAHLDFHRPFGLDGLEVAEAGAWLDGSRWGLSAGWRQTGVEGLYAEHGFRLTQTVRFGKPGGFPGAFDLGAAWYGWRTQWPGGRTGTAWDHGLGLAWRPFPRLKAGAFVLGLPLDLSDASRTDRSRTGDRSRAGRILQWGLEADSGDRDGSGPDGQGPGGQGPGGRILRLDFRKTGETPWRTLASLSLGFHPGVELTGGFAGPPFQASLGARLSMAGWDLCQALRYHRFLGRTWLSGLAYSRAWGAAPRN